MKDKQKDVTVRISKRMYCKMLRLHALAYKSRQISEEVDNYLSEKGVDIDKLRITDAGGYVDMVDYGRGIVMKKDIEIIFNEYKSKKGIRNIEVSKKVFAKDKRCSDGFLKK